jgi:hypothetical protein
MKSYTSNNQKYKFLNFTQFYWLKFETMKTEIRVCSQI